MNLHELKLHVDRLVELSHLQHLDPTEVTVGIMVKTVGSVGRTPTVPLKSIQLGFDWDRGKCLLQPESDLREIGRDELAALRKSYDDMGWAMLKKSGPK
jgi:hypothetical protein